MVGEESYLELKIRYKQLGKMMKLPSKELGRSFNQMPQSFNQRQSCKEEVKGHMGEGAVGRMATNPSTWCSALNNHLYHPPSPTLHIHRLQDKLKELHSSMG